MQNQKSSINELLDFSSSLWAALLAWDSIGLPLAHSSWVLELVVLVELVKMLETGAGQGTQPFYTAIGVFRASGCTTAELLEVSHILKCNANFCKRLYKIDLLMRKPHVYSSSSFSSQGIVGPLFPEEGLLCKKV